MKTARARLEEILLIEPSVAFFENGLKYAVTRITSTLNFGEPEYHCSRCQLYLEPGHPRTCRHMKKAIKIARWDD